MLLLSLCLVGAATAKTGPVSTREWQSVLKDWLVHGRFSQPHSCAAAVVARTHAPPAYKEGTPLVDALNLYELKACRSPRHDPGAVEVGMSNRQVAALAGVPLPRFSGTKSWAYPYGHFAIGLRFYFSPAGYVALVQRAVSGCCSVGPRSTTTTTATTATTTSSPEPDVAAGASTGVH